MKIKLSVLFFSLALIGVAVFSAVSSAVASAVPIPIEINLWVEGLIFAVVTAGFAYLFEWLGLDLRGLAKPLSGALSGWLLLELQGLVNLIPAAYDPYVTIAFRIIVIILSGLGSLFILAKFRGTSKLL